MKLENNYLEYIKTKLNGKKVCVFPMGICGKSMLLKLKEYGIKIDCFSDNNEKLWGTNYDGVMCISPKTLLDKKENLVIIIESLYFPEIKKQLEGEGFSNIMRVFPSKFLIDEFLEKEKPQLNDYIKNLKNILDDEKSKSVVDKIIEGWTMADLSDDFFDDIYDKNQYFDTEVLKLSDEEVFVDAGAYTGDTAENFLETTKGKFKELHLFELDPLIYQRLKETEKTIKEKCSGDVYCYDYGLSDKEETVFFGAGDSNSTIATSGECSGVVKALDDVVKKEVTFIKMDIEGSEMRALKGAEKTIKEYKPKLAICIYHKPEDLFEIPAYIKSLVPEYKIYIRHYTNLFYETVCYATLG